MLYLNVISTAFTIYYDLYLLQYGKYLKVDLKGFKVNNQKTRENMFNFFLPPPGIKPTTCQSWAFCLVIFSLVIWAPTLQNKDSLFSLCSFTLVAKKENAFDFFPKWQDIKDPRCASGQTDLVSNWPIQSFNTSTFLF